MSVKRVDAVSMIEIISELSDLLAHDALRRSIALLVVQTALKDVPVGVLLDELVAHVQASHAQLALESLLRNSFVI